MALHISRSRLSGPNPKGSLFSQVWDWFKPWRELDGMLLGTVLTLSGFGILAIHSASNPDGLFWVQQLVMVCLSLMPCLCLARWNYERLLGWHWLVYGLTLAGLVAVMFVGISAGGAERWIPILGVQVQPSEFAKVGVIITLAAVLHHWPIRSFAQLWIPLGVLAPPWLLIFLQPNLGTALVFLVIVLTMVYWAGAKASWLILLCSPVLGAILYGIQAQTGGGWLLWVWLLWCVGMAALAAVSLSWRWTGPLIFGVSNLLSGQLGQLGWGLLKPYQRQRLLIFTDPSQDPLGSGYHLIQSRIAIGAGGLWGQGLRQGTQTQLDFIPEQHTDFIFSVVGEELGLVGALLVLGLLWVTCMRLVLVAQNAKDNFGSLIAVGILAMIVFQAVVNIGMTVGLAPITGLPLPFLSYGRSALLTNFIAMGLVQSVMVHRFRTSFFT
ncbi:MAG: rod shape-determining protein RodA [Synechococcaceae cyanobacterium SM2_3_2]|nr:rod shape-determining protein RodA [Synechococcaceae cyanobacterium SM2_3_2]